MDPDTVSTLKNHCVYSLAVLLLMLLGDKYCRPSYAKTDNVNEVYAAIAKREDSKYLSTWMDPEVGHSGGRKQALKAVLTTFSAQQQEGVLLSWMDSFKVNVTEVLSSYELVMMETPC